MYHLAKEQWLMKMPEHIVIQKCGEILKLKRADFLEYLRHSQVEHS